MGKVGLLTLLIIIVLGCEQPASHDVVIENNSDHNIWLITQNSSNFSFNTGDSFLLLSQSEFVFNDFLIDGSLDQFDQQCGLLGYTIDTLNTVVQDSGAIQLTLDLYQSSNWTYNVIEPAKKGLGSTKKGGHSECRLIIQQQHIK